MAGVSAGGRSALATAWARAAATCGVPACRVELFSFAGRDLESVWRANAPDPVTHMAWLQGTLLCAGPWGLYAVALTPPPSCGGKLREVAKWPQRCRCSLAATGAATAAVFHDQTVAHFDLAAGTLSAPWRWEPSGGAELFLEHSEARPELLTSTPCALHHWRRYMLIAGLPGQFQVRTGGHGVWRTGGHGAWRAPHATSMSRTAAECSSRGLRGF